MTNGTDANSIDGGRWALAALREEARECRDEAERSVPEDYTRANHFTAKADGFEKAADILEAALSQPAPAAAGAGLREALERAEYTLTHFAALAPNVAGAKQALDAVRAALAASPAGAGTVGGEDAIRRALDASMEATGKNAQQAFLRSAAARTAPPAAGAPVGEDTLAVIDRIVAEAQDISGHIHMGGRSLYLAGQRLRSIADDIATRQSAQAGAGERVRHVKRGSEYEVIGEAEAQVSKGHVIYPNPGGPCLARDAKDGDKLTVYRDPKAGKLWCRFTDEFRDGRFETLTPAQAGAGDRFVLVPREPTEAMLDAHWNMTGESVEMRSRVHERAKAHWAAMLAAAPIGTGNGEASGS